MNYTASHAIARPKRALVVEDHKEIALLIATILTHQGIEAEVLDNGAQAIVCLREHASDYGLVCSDVELRGASGWTLLEWVHVRQPDLPIVLISGTNDGDFVVEAIRRGAVAALRKPFNVARLQQTLAEVFPYL